jgi:hypothetical protein
MKIPGLDGQRRPDATIDISAAVRDIDQCKPATDTCAKPAAMIQHLHDPQPQPSPSLAPSKCTGIWTQPNWDSPSVQKLTSFRFGCRIRHTHAVLRQTQGEIRCPLQLRHARWHNIAGPKLKPPDRHATV